jgi:hypothetical protein
MFEHFTYLGTVDMPKQVKFSIESTDELDEEYIKNNAIKQAENYIAQCIGRKIADKIMEKMTQKEIYKLLGSSDKVQKRVLINLESEVELSKY